MIRNISIETAATPAGVVFVPFRFRGWRSCLALPPANGSHPSGMTAVEPGGFGAISRWLSAATPPETRRHPSRIPEGCQRWGAAWAMDRTRLRFLRDQVMRGRVIRGCRSCLAQPPANGWHPFGMSADRVNAHLKKMGAVGK